MCVISYILVQPLPPTLATRTALNAGLSYRDLYEMRDNGELVELSRGVFRTADAQRPPFRICWPSPTVPLSGDLRGLGCVHRAPPPPCAPAVRSRAPSWSTPER